MQRKHMTNTELNLDEINFIIEYALEEDVKTGDITTNTLIPDDKMVKAFMMAKADGVIAGLKVAEKIFKKLNPSVEFYPLVNDGEHVKNQTRIAEVKGSYRAILTGERLALNFIQRMSGIATKTSIFVESVKEYKAQILDTRKTLPGLRTLDKYSVKMGGGTNHRIGLYDMVMIKDNHIEVAGSITEAVKQIRANVPSDIKIEVETKNMIEVDEALNSGADIIMLDNMNNEQMKEAVDFINGKAVVEASGSINLQRVKDVAATGVDYISVGGLTHSVNALDIGMYIEI